MAALLLAGCGGSGGDPPPAPAPQPPPPSPNPVPGPGQVLIAGQVTYDFVPHQNGGQGLDYGQTEARPARLVNVQYVVAGNAVATARTDINGFYDLVVDENQSGFVRVRAESIETGTPGWNFRVLDNTSGDAIYTLDGAVASSGTANSTRDLHAPSGWTGSGYGNERAAAPFAILDTIYEAAELLLTADPAIDFPPLATHWSPDNRPTVALDGEPDLTTGEIGTSFYGTSFGANGIYLLGAEDNDTEEYDPHVILHEFGHYLEDRLGRSDSVGGPHAFGDLLDMRVAFSEGWSTAFAAIALDDPIYRDAGGFRQGGAFSFSVESRANGAPGWFSEQSVYELIYDLVDANADFGDAVNLPFGDVWTAMTGAVTTTPAVTSIFPLLNAVKIANPGEQVLIDQLAASQSIDSVTSDFADGETNSGGGAHVLPIYTPITVNGGTPVNLCSTDDFRSSVTGSTNKLSSRRYLRFTPNAAGNVTITVEATSIPAGEFADPDFWVYRQGPIAVSDGPPSAACQDVNGGAWAPGTCVESNSVPVTVTEHVLEIYEWTNTNADDDPDYPPIGTTCFDVTVTQP